MKSLMICKSTEKPFMAFDIHLIYSGESTANTSHRSTGSGIPLFLIREIEDMRKLLLDRGNAARVLAVDDICDFFGILTSFFSTIFPSLMMLIVIR